MFSILSSSTLGISVLLSFSVSEDPEPLPLSVSFLSESPLLSPIVGGPITGSSLSVGSLGILTLILTSESVGSSSFSLGGFVSFFGINIRQGTRIAVRRQIAIIMAIVRFMVNCHPF